MTPFRMKTASILLSIATLHIGVAMLAPSAADAQEASTLTITFQGITRPMGEIRGQLFDSEAAYRGKGEAVSAFALPVSGDSVSTTVSGLKPGRYAIRAFHDIDGDGQLDANPFGIPTEPFGFSNDAKGAFGPASWDDAAFEVSVPEASAAITID